MRAFFGLSPDIKTKLAIEGWRNKVFPHFDAPVPAANFHVTLAFLGKISPKQLDALCESVNQIDQIHAFDVSLNQIGYWSKPKALWLGCKKYSKYPSTTCENSVSNISLSWLATS